VEIDIPTYENPEISLMHDESLKEIKSYVNKLPESLRTAFTLREVDGKSYEEIANITNTPIGTVRSRIFRAREGILEYIAKEL
jgi:RNA polymerase sigma-70 factor (ECF subfamily)